MKRSIMAAMAALVLCAAATAYAADEIHWTFTGPTSVSFDWRGPESSIQYGLTPAYGLTVTAVTPSPLPWSSAGPFWEARLLGLMPDTVYHYSIGGGPDHTFRTPRAPGTSNFTVMAQGDIGSVVRYWRVGPIQQQVADQQPDFTLMLGDLTYGNAHGQAAVDNHFNDVMVWSRDAAYMPAWGNHEYETGTYVDDFRNYKGRFDLPNPRTSPGAPAAGGPGEDWYWFDYGNVRFIAYPEPFAGAWADWYPKASALMDSAQDNPNIGFIVTFGHRPAFSSGHHPGAPSLKNYLGLLGLAHSKYKLNLNGHSHNYERTFAQNGVIHITAGGGGSHLQDDPSGGCLYLGGCPPPVWSAFRAFRHGPVKLAFSSNEIRVEAICGPPGDAGSNPNDVICTPGSVFDSVTIKIVTPESQIDAPVADAEIEAGQSVMFAGTGNDPDGHLPLRYQWDFDGGAPNSMQEDPGPVAFNAIGVYRVSFTVQDSAGYADPTPDIRTISVGAVNHPPDGAIVAPAGPMTIEQGESAIFEGAGTDPDGNTPLTYFWNFDEGGPNVTVEDPGVVTFLKTGTFVVEFIVTDSEGLADPTPAQVEITVVPNQPPTGEIVLPLTDVTVEIGQAIEFQGAAQDPDGHLPLTHVWNFGGGVPDAMVEGPVSISFPTPGAFTVTFTVTDALGLASTPATRTVTVLEPNVMPDGAIDTPVSDVTIEPGASVTFSGSGTDADASLPLSFAWSFGGGAADVAVEDPGAITFATPGTYVATLTVSDARGGVDASPATRTVTVLEPNVMPDGAIDAPVSDVTIEPGASVTFSGSGTDADASLPLSFAWSFGGGAADVAIEDPGAITFVTPGTYVVTLTVSDARGGVDTSPATRTVTVLEPNVMPDGAIDAPVSDVTIEPGAAVVFAGSGTDADASLPLSFAWSFGGGAADVAIEDPGAITFVTPGTYVVTLTVSDARGGVDASPATRTVTVLEPNVMPDGAIDAPVSDVTIEPGAAVVFAGSGTDADASLPLSFAWSFGGGAADVAVEDPGAITFATPGTYVVTLTVSDARGGVDASPATRTVTVLEPNVMPDGAIDAPVSDVTIEPGASVTFSGSGTDADASLPLSFAWSFGGGAADVAVEDPGAITFATPGTYVVTLTVSDARGGVDASPATRTVTVLEPNVMPDGAIDTPVSDVTIEPGAAVVFAASGTDADASLPLSFAWSFGGGAADVAIEDPGAITFVTPGTYVVTLTVSDARGGVDTSPATRTVTVLEPNVMPDGAIDAPVSDVTIEPGAAVVFAGSGTDADASLPLSFAWSFGGGAADVAIEDPGAITFVTPGTYVVTLTVSDARGGVDASPATRTVTVLEPNVMPDGAIDAPVSDVTIEPGAAVVFAGSGTDADASLPLSFAWSFGGGAADVAVEDPGAITFATPGTYVVTLTVSDARGGVDASPATRTVTVLEPNVMPDGAIDAPVSDVTIEPGASVTFSGSGTDADASLPLSFAWSFGGGAADVAVEDPGAITFATPGTYVVTLTVSDARGGVDASPATRTVTVLEPNVMPDGAIDAPVSDVTIEPGAAVVFAGSGTDADASLPLSFAWSFGGGAADVAVEDPGAITFVTPGTYVVTLTVTDARGGVDATPATRTVTVLAANRPPIAVLAMFPATGNAPLSTIADATGSSDPDGPLASYAFNFGDGTTAGPSATPTQAHTYAAGNWVAHLTVTDSSGAAHAVQAPVIVAPVIPGFNFVLNPSVETDLAGWAPHAGSSIQRVTGGFDGPSGIRIVGPDSLVTFGVNDSPNWVAQTPQSHVGVPYRFSAWVRSPSSTGRARLQVREFKNGVKIGSNTFSAFVPLTPTWQLVTVDRVVMMAGSTLDLQVFDYPVAPNETMIVDNIGIHAIGATTGIDELAGSTEFAVIAAPNPMRTGGTVAFVMPRASFARIEIIDLSGRRVRSLLDEHEVAAGLHRVVFDGRATDGTRLASGIYFYRVTTAVGNVTRRFVMLK